MNTNEQAILVTGATGRQGGATARHLRAMGFQVRALTRNPNQVAALRLQEQGCELVAGDMNNPESLYQAMKGVHGVFSVQDFWQAGMEKEIHQGMNVADAALSSGVNHFVYSSVASANKQTGLPHFDSKARIEEHVKSLGLPYTILRPVFFMENWMTYAGDSILSGTLPQPLDPDRSLQQVAVDDIGRLAGIAFHRPDRWIGQELDIAGDELTMPQVADAFSLVLGHKVNFVQVPWDQFRQAAGEESWKMYRWFSEVGYEVNIASLRQHHPWMHTLEQFVRELRDRGELKRAA